MRLAQADPYFIDPASGLPTFRIVGKAAPAPVVARPSIPTIVLFALGGYFALGRRPIGFLAGAAAGYYLPELQAYMERLTT